eukprot:4432173-Prymnesium_polylepis.1
MSGPKGFAGMDPEPPPPPGMSVVDFLRKYELPGVNEPAEMGMHAIHYAAYADDADQIRALVEAGADPNVGDIGLKGPGGCTPLFLAALMGCENATRALLEAGAEHSKPNEGMQTPLFMCAGWSAKSGVLRLLMDAKADPNEIVYKGTKLRPGVPGFYAGFSALHVAAAVGTPEAVRSLLLGGADPQVLVHESAVEQRLPGVAVKNAYEVAMMYGNKPTASLLLEMMPQPASIS